jgi:Ca2+-binding EF-hand superfamily protein
MSGGKGFLPKESITHLPARQDMKEHEYQEICSVFNVTDIDGDNSISRQE